MPVDTLSHMACAFCSMTPVKWQSSTNMTNTLLVIYPTDILSTVSNKTRKTSCEVSTPFAMNLVKAAHKFFAYYEYSTYSYMCFIYCCISLKKWSGQVSRLESSIWYKNRYWAERWSPSSATLLPWLSLPPCTCIPPLLLLFYTCLCLNSSMTWYLMVEKAGR